MNKLATVEASTQVSELNAFEITIQAHEKELDFIPCMDNEDSRKLSSDALKAARVTWNLIDGVRLEKKKEAEVLANSIHTQGKEALARLEVKYLPHKGALDNYKLEQKAIEEALKQQFSEACQWLNDVVNACQFASTDEIKSFILEVGTKDQDNTGINLSKDQSFEYAKIRLSTIPKLEASLNQRIIADAEEARQQQAAIELAAQQETLRKQQEEFEAQQQEQAKINAAREATEQAERKSKERVEQAERETKEAKEREEIQKLAAKKSAQEAEERAAQAAENARLEEIHRQNEEKRLAREAEEKREANKRHVGKIRKETKESLMKINGVSEALAKDIVQALTNGKIDHSSIKY